MSCSKDGKSGFKFGKSGFCYTYIEGNERSRAQAIARAKLQGRAIKREKE
jgi:hypothetical protein